MRDPIDSLTAPDSHFAPEPNFQTQTAWRTGRLLIGRLLSERKREGEWKKHVCWDMVRAGSVLGSESGMLLMFEQPFLSCSYQSFFRALHNTVQCTNVTRCCPPWTWQISQKWIVNHWWWQSYVEFHDGKIFLAGAGGSISQCNHCYSHRERV